MHRLAVTASLLVAVLLTGCEMLGIESTEKIALLRAADGKAVGGACRHAARAIEDCYALNRKADRAAIFAGWRDMNDYMRENKIEPVVPQGVASAHAAGKAAAVVGVEREPEGRLAPPEKRPARPAAEPARSKAGAS